MSARPVFPGDFPDPFVLLAQETYYAFATNAAGVNVQVMSSPDLREWTFLGDALPVLPGWARAGRTWAPSVLARGSTFVLYYTVLEHGSGRQAISLASSSQPQGPYVDASPAPLVFQLDMGGSIDPSPFFDREEPAFLLWKSDGNAIGRRSSLWAQQLSDDGQSLVGTPSRLLDHDRGWERPLVEAPSLVRSDGRYFLFYSANRWDTAGYCIGYAVSDSPLGPYRKVTATGPWFGSDPDVAGPGGQEFFTDANGRRQMAYHGWTPGLVGYPKGARSLRIAEMTIALAPTLGS